jgi:Xaa-Pro aminopeptidase
VYTERLERARARMQATGVDVLLLSVGADLPYFTGYTAMPLERLTMLVVPRDGEATLVVPGLEAPRVEERSDAFRMLPWTETEDPIAIVARLAGQAGRAAIGDRTWASFVLGLQEALPRTAFIPASAVTGPLREVKDAAEIDALRSAARAVDSVATAMRERPFAGRTEADLAREFVARMLEAGHERANFAIVAAGPNAASPHHEPGDRVVAEGDSVVCDFGGAWGGGDGKPTGYCSDITRTYVVGEPPTQLAELYAVLAEAQERGVQAAQVGVPCEAVDAAARSVIDDAGYGEFFIHRTGHGIGLEEHETPYLVAGNATPLRAGHAFSVEPGIYLPGRCGARIEDIVVATEAGPERLNQAPRDLAVVG